MSIILRRVCGGGGVRPYSAGGAANQCVRMRCEVRFGGRAGAAKIKAGRAVGGVFMLKDKGGCDRKILCCTPPTTHCGHGYQAMRAGGFSETGDGGN